MQDELVVTGVWHPVAEEAVKIPDDSDGQRTLSSPSPVTSCFSMAGFSDVTLAVPVFSR